MKSSEIAAFLKKELIGEDIVITGFSSLSNLMRNTLVFAKKCNSNYLEILANVPNVLAIVCDGYENITTPHIVSPNPRLDFLRVVSAFFAEKDIPVGIHHTANVEKGAIIGKNVSIGANCHIGGKVRIGDNTVVLPNCSFYGKVTIGANCYIKPGVVIGGPGFGFEYDENGVPVHFPHTGEVIIGNNVYIGANSTIDRATIDATIIEDNVKIDNLVHIAHNCRVGKNTLMTGCSTISGGVQVGQSCWIAPNSTVYQQLKIGEKSTIGIGAVVLKGVKAGKTVFGNPACAIDI